MKLVSHKTKIVTDLEDTTQLLIQERGHAPQSLLKLVIKKMAAIHGALYFMYLPPPL